MNETDHILLIPGTESPAELTFAGLGPVLQRDYAVHMVDFSSKSGYDPNSQLDNYTKQVERELERIDTQGGRLHILGYSLGSLIALRAAARAIRPIDSLVLLGSWMKSSRPQRDRHDFWLELFESDPRLAGEFSHLLQYSSDYLNLISEQQTPARFAALVPTSETLHRVLVNKLADNANAAAEAKCRTLIINGTADQKVPQHCGYDLLGAIENSQLALVSSGHALLKERLGEVYGLTKDFIDRTLPDISVIHSPEV